MKGFVIRVLAVLPVSAAFASVSSATGVGDYILQGLGANSTTASSFATSVSNSIINGVPTGKTTSLQAQCTGNATIVFPGQATAGTYEGSCDYGEVWCLPGRSDCISSANSYVASCAPQWSSYHAQESGLNTATTETALYVPDTKTSTITDVVNYTVVGNWATTSTPTGPNNYYVNAWTETVTPVYVFGSPTAAGRTVYTTTYTETQASSRLPSNVVQIDGSTTTYTTTLTGSPASSQTPCCQYTTVSTASCGQCTIFGGTVQLLYWPTGPTGPTPSASLNGTAASLTRNTTAAGLEVASTIGLTLTSPSVYISFQTAYASDSCSAVGSAHTGSVLSLLPNEVSTLSWPAQGIPIQTQMLKYVPVPLNYDDLQGIVPIQVYEEQESCAVGNGCPTIYPGYKPTLVVPPQIRSLDPAWKSCIMDFHGLYDPPIALQSTTLDLPSTSAPPAALTSTTLDLPPPPTSTATPSRSLSPNTAPATSTATVLPDQLPTSSSQPNNSPSHSGSFRPSSMSESMSDPSSTSKDPGGIFISILSDLTATTMPADPQSSAGAPPITVGSSTITPDSASNYEIGSLTLAPGGSAITVSGTAYSLAPSGTAVVVNGMTSPVARASSSDLRDPAMITIGFSVVTPNAAGQYVVGSQTLAPGSAITADGSTYSLAQSGPAIVVNGVTQALTLPAQATIPAVSTLGSTTVTESAVGASQSAFLIDGQSLIPGHAIIIGSGTGATTLMLQTSGGRTEVLFGTTSTEIIDATTASSASSTKSASSAGGSVTLTAPGDPATQTTSEACQNKGQQAFLIAGVAAVAALMSVL